MKKNINNSTKLRLFVFLKNLELKIGFETELFLLFLLERREEIRNQTFCLICNDLQYFFPYFILWNLLS